MDWSIVERLAPSLAWPVVFLIALPFVIWKLDELIASIRDARALSEQLPEFMSSVKEFDKISDKIELVRKNSETIIRTLDASEVQRETEVAEVSELADAIIPSDIAQAVKDPVPKGTENMFKSMTEAWTELNAALDDAYSRGRLGVPDKRSIGTAARRLADGRRKRPISWDEVDRLATLHSLYKRFLRMKTDRDKYLTPEVYLNFRSGVAGAISALEAFQ